MTEPSPYFPEHDVVKVCPNCGTSPVVPFMYGKVMRMGFLEDLADLWRWIRRKPPIGSVTVICWECKEIIGHDGADGRFTPEKKYLPPETTEEP